MLANSSNKLFKALSGIRTKRRIALTGSPFQNHLREYFNMISWVRPGVLGSSEEFEREYATPIMMGMASDSSIEAVRRSHAASRKLHDALSPYVQRKDSKVLKKDLPPMQQVVLHVRQSKAQARLFRSFKTFQKISGCNDFFKCYQMTRTLTNHPGILLVPSRSSSSERTVKVSLSAKCDALSSEETSVAENGESVDEVEPCELPSESEVEELYKTESRPKAYDDTVGCSSTVSLIPDGGNNVLTTEVAVADETSATKRTESSAPRVDDCLPGAPSSVDEAQEWWRKSAEGNGHVEALKEVENGYKVVLFLHILVHAQTLGDKVLVFSQCLRTLDFIEEVLNLDDWAKHVPSLASSFPDVKLGGWQKNTDYLRIDGGTKFAERGSLIDRFNDDKTCSGLMESATNEDNTKLFLLSSKACGIGVNLHAANRVVLFDNHFNPTVMTQALYRCYRYGQTKPVFAYRLITEGSMEEKIYSRSVNKTGVGTMRVSKQNASSSFH